MTATAHALVGGVIASATANNPALGVTLCFVSHPLLDMIPHWDFGVGWRKKNRLTLVLESVFDLALGVVLAFFLFGQNISLIYFLLCIFASEFWDLMMMPYLIWGWKGPFLAVYNIQSKMQANTKSIMAGILTQVGTVMVISLALHTVRF